ncbi:DUF1080 domain-containing protein [Aureibaculum algae]|uniref:DUF1080 domain-containing protein n=1 Tax=Aureibaculum algae TaxID=2584122 RepID=A0A5B7TU08_9FLAO|nr:DUF1080 domain-containing protein [Aureibaculum algae]QCX40325.1 DUF1080 domain-containing protein [Aureibaculum algae]
MKRLALLIIIVITNWSCEKQLKKEKEQDVEWRSLFNGKNLEGWIPKLYHYEVGDNYANTFRVVDGKIQVNYVGYDGEFGMRYGHLFFNESFSSYHLKFSYKFTDQWLEDAPHFTYRNSGVMFHSQDPKTILKEQNWPISVEYQILAAEKENEPRPTGNMCSPRTEVIFENKVDPRHCISSSSKTYPWNQWQNGELIVYKDSLIIHKVNGKEVLRYTKPHIGGDIITGYDPVIKVDGKPLTEGYIGLQSEGQGIEFKDIKIKNLE